MGWRIMEKLEVKRSVNRRNFPAVGYRFEESRVAMEHVSNLAFALVWISLSSNFRLGIGFELLLIFILTIPIVPSFWSIMGLCLY